MKIRNRCSSSAADPEPDPKRDRDQSVFPQTPESSPSSQPTSSHSGNAAPEDIVSRLVSELRKQPPASPFILLFQALSITTPEERERFLALTGHPMFAKVMHHLAGELAGAAATADGLVELLAYLIRDYTLKEIREEKLLTNDNVEIFGGLGENDFRQLRVNGSDWLPLERREFILLKILQKHALDRREARNTLQRVPDSFLRVSAIINRIDALRASRKELGEFWVDIIDTDLHRVVSELRAKLSRHGLNPNLIETGPHHAGYRLSCRVGGILPSLGPEGGDCPPLGPS